MTIRHNLRRYGVGVYVAIVALLLKMASLCDAAPREIEIFDDPGAALADIVDKPRVIAFGEFHELNDSKKTRSALAHFHQEILASLIPLSGDLIVETWVTTGSCGEQEKSVVAQVEKTTQRPATTEDEIVTVMKQAKAGGVQPHMLEIDCHAYQGLTDPETGKVDYIRLLTLVTEGLQKKIVAALAAAKTKKSDKRVLVYGGALHNDVFPRKELAAYSFARAIGKRTSGRYLEVDLYVPEYIEADKDITAQAWYPRYMAAMKPGKVVRVRRSRGSYILVFPRAVENSK